MTMCMAKRIDELEAENARLILGIKSAFTEGYGWGYSDGFNSGQSPRSRGDDGDGDAESAFYGSDAEALINESRQFISTGYRIWCDMVYWDVNKSPLIGAFLHLYL